MLAYCNVFITGPKASGSGNCLPKYPGFESDVFNLIRDYFTNIEEPIIPFEFYNLIMCTFDNYCSETAFKSKNMSSFLKCPPSSRELLNLPSNCVYETVFSGNEPVTKIVPIDELSTVFPNFADYFGRPILINANSPMNSLPMSDTFKAISTMPRSNSKLRPQITSSRGNCISTPHNVKNSQMMSDILCLDSPPESGEYMLNKNMDLKRFYSLHRGKNYRTNSNITSQVGHSSTSKQYQLLQLILLTLPSANRRHLQLLLRLFHKIIRNKELCLLTKDSLALKEHVSLLFC